MSEFRNEHPSGESPVGRNIAVRRKRAGKTQTVLAEQVGVSLRTVQNWESNTTQPKWPELRELAKALDCLVADFFERRFAPREPNGHDTPKAAA